MAHLAHGAGQLDFAHNGRRSHNGLIQQRAAKAHPFGQGNARAGRLLLQIVIIEQVVVADQPCAGQYLLGVILKVNPCGVHAFAHLITAAGALRFKLAAAANGLVFQTVNRHLIIRNGRAHGRRAASGKKSAFRRFARARRRCIHGRFHRNSPARYRQTRFQPLF